MKTYQVEVHDNGDKKWYINGNCHREDGPAIEYVNGDKEWYLNGKYHREDGPACEYANGDKRWYLNGKYLTKEEFNSYLKSKQAYCANKIVEIEGKKYKLVEV